MLELWVVAGYDELSELAADYVALAVKAKHTSSIVLAMGNTPMGAYADLIERFRAGEFDPSRLTAFQLDAYLGLTRDDPRSLYGWLERSFLTPMDIGPSRVVDLPGDAADPQALCSAYDQAVAAALISQCWVWGPVTPDEPAAFLQTAANVTILADRDAWPGKPIQR